jgi:hypothetical protein
MRPSLVASRARPRSNLAVRPGECQSAGSTGLEPLGTRFHRYFCLFAS